MVLPPCFESLNDSFCSSIRDMVSEVLKKKFAWSVEKKAED